MKVGILGSGIVGRVLASAFLQEGHSVMLGTRNISKDEVIKWQQENIRRIIGFIPGNRTVW
jgi:predicted dinucleotide-binding enzyme